MAYPHVGQAFELPIGSSKSTIDQITSLTFGDLTILCIRSSCNQLQLRSFYYCNRSVIVSSLRLSLPRETSNRVVSAVLLSIYPKLLVSVLTLNGTLLTIDLSKFLIRGCLPEIIHSGVNESRSFANIPADKSPIPIRRVSLFDLSVGSQGRSNLNGTDSPAVGVNSKVKFDQYLPTSLTLEQTLKLTISIEEIELSSKKDVASYSPLCVDSYVRNQSVRESSLDPSWESRNPSQQLTMKSFIGCINGFLIVSVQQVSCKLISHELY